MYQIIGRVRARRENIITPSQLDNLHFPWSLQTSYRLTQNQDTYILQMTTANTKEDEETGIPPADARMSAINISKFARAKSTLTSWWVIYLNFA